MSIVDFLRVEGILVEKVLGQATKAHDLRVFDLLRGAAVKVISAHKDRQIVQVS